MSTESKVSFAIRRPTPVSRASSTGNDSDFKIPALPPRLTNSANSSAPGSPLRHESPKPRSRTYHERDSSDEDEELEDELVTGFDKFGVQRVREKKPQGPLIIPALKNKDWRDQARKRKNIYIPPSAAAETGADGSVGGLGTRDSINSGPQIAGLQMKKKVKLEEDAMELEEDTTVVAVTDKEPQVEETEDQKAIRALIAGAEGDGSDGPRVEIIPAVSEDDAYRQDVAELPEPASLHDYERVPVADFGAALLRGMGWKEGTAASRKGKGPVEPWLPSARPALLGIGAKEKEALDDGSKGKKKSFVDKRYIPVIKQERRDGKRDKDDRDSASASGSLSRRRTPSPRGSRRSPSPDRRRDRDRYSSGDRDKERDRRRDKDRDSARDRDRREEKYGREDDYGDRERKRDADHRDVSSDSRQQGDRRRDRSDDGERPDRYRRDRDRR